MLRKLAKATDEVKEIHEEVKIINYTHTHTPPVPKLPYSK